MNAQAFFESLWSETLPAEEESIPLCRFAQAFHTWTECALLPTLQHPTLITINQAKILLLDKYFEWRSIAPRTHRDKFNTTGHTCLWSVFEAAYYRLREVELSLTPPLLFVPQPQPVLPPPPPATQPQIAGIFIGEEE